MAIPWSKLLSMSPAIVEGGRMLWSAVAQRQPGVAPASRPEEAAAAADVRLAALERRVNQLAEEAAASFDVVKSITEEHSKLAEHHAELVSAMDALLGRARLLAWGVGALALVVLGLLVFLAIRWPG